MNADRGAGRKIWTQTARDEINAFLAIATGPIVAFLRTSEVRVLIPDCSLCLVGSGTKIAGLAPLITSIPLSYNRAWSSWGTRDNVTICIVVIVRV